MKKIIVIGGPTASGKTSLSVALAKEINCPIISADSRQFYKELSIGTAKPSLEEQEGVKHYFINSHTLKEPLSAGEYEHEAILLIKELFKTNKTIILTGGSGMFIDAILYGIDDIPKSKDLKEELIHLEREKGLGHLLEILKLKDPVYFEEVDKSNAHRIIRALEAIQLSNQKFSDLRKNKAKQRDFKHNIFIIDHQREELYKRINLRVDLMVKDGLFEEVKSVIDFRNLQSLNTVGYKEVFQYFDNEINQHECIELIKRNTRRYAKRQITWFKRYKNAVWIKYTNTSDMLKTILEELKQTD